MTAVFHSPSAHPLGFHGACFDSSDSEHATPLNIQAALSWIPIIGAIVGAYRFYTAYQGYSDEKDSVSPNAEVLAFFKASMIRGGIEAISLGFAGPLLLIIDMIVSIGRTCTEDTYTQ